MNFGQKILTMSKLYLHYVLLPVVMFQKVFFSRYFILLVGYYSIIGFLRPDNTRK